jgi:hypothetical protein
VKARYLLAVAGVLALGAAGLGSGRTEAAFRWAADSPGSSFSVAPDFTAPTVVRTRVADLSNPPSYGLRQCRFYQAYAEVTDTGNPASGVASVEADLTGLSGGSGRDTLAAGLYSLDGVGYGYRSLPLLVTVAPGTASYGLFSTDFAGNARRAGDFPVTVSAGPATGAVFLTGLEQGVAASTAPGVFDAVTGVGVSADGSVRRSGAYALRVAPANAAAYASVTLSGTSTTVVVRFAVRLGTLPAATVNLFAVVPSGGNIAYLAYNAATGRLGVRWGTGAITNASTAAAAGTWYVVEMRVSLANPHTVEWRLDGSDQSTAPSAETARTVSGLQFGTTATTVTYTAHFDDVIASLAATAHPIGNGRILALSVDGSGMHNGADRFRNNDNSAIDATSWARVDEIPANSAADFVKQVTNSTSSYLEFTFADTSEPCINAVGALLAYHSAGTNPNNGRSSIFSGSTESVVFSGDMSVTALTYRRAVVTPEGGSWTTSLANSLVARVGYTTDRNPNPYWDALLLEYDIPLSW